MKLIDPVVYVENYDGEEIMKFLANMASTCYNYEFDISKDNYKDLLLKCIKDDHTSILEHKTITIKMIGDSGVYKDLERHRYATFSVESIKNLKYENELKLMKPVNIEEQTDFYYEWEKCVKKLEESFQIMKKEGATEEQLRMIIPYSTAIEMNVTCNIREWRHLLSLRTTFHAHPAIRQLLIPVLVKFKQDMPELFADIEYDTEFPKEKYAKVLPLQII